MGLSSASAQEQPRSAAAVWSHRSVCARRLACWAGCASQCAHLKSCFSYASQQGVRHEQAEHSTIAFDLRAQSWHHRSAHRRSALHCTCDWRVISTMHKCRNSGCSIGVRSVLGGRLSAVLMRARRALGVAELAGRDGRVNGPGCRTVKADSQRLLDGRGPSMDFAPMREVRFGGKGT
jgi:hypothetical protein